MPLDDTPIDTDWDNLQDLWDDMAQFAKDNPDHTFMCADDPGGGIRVPRVGWIAYLIRQNDDIDADEQVQEWTIRITDVRNSYPHALRSKFVQALSSSNSRQQMLVSMLIEARGAEVVPAEPVPEPPSVWDRLRTEED